MGTVNFGEQIERVKEDDERLILCGEHSHALEVGEQFGQLGRRLSTQLGVVVVSDLIAHADQQLRNA